MKKFLSGAGLATAVSVLALAPAAGATTSNPGNVGDGCVVGGPQGTTCTWTADVSGSYAAAGNGSYLVQVQTGVDSSGNPTWGTVASGTTPTAGSPGSLAKGGTYRITVSGNEGGAIGSVTGQNGAV